MEANHDDTALERELIATANENDTKPKSETLSKSEHYFVMRMNFSHRIFAHQSQAYYRIIYYYLLLGITFQYRGIIFFLGATKEYRYRGAAF